MKHSDNSQNNFDYSYLLPYGSKSFGEGSDSFNAQKWLKAWFGFKNDFSLFLILAGTRTAEIEGISAAGATPESRRFTALADAEFLLKGPLKNRKWQLPDLPAGISPAIISYAASKLIGITPLILPVGLSQSPPFPHLRVDAPPYGPSKCISTGKAMNISRVYSLWQEGFDLGLKINKPLVIAECVPGGTTTAQAVLTGFGLQVSELVSGSSIKPPIDIKQSLVEEGLSAANLGTCPSSKQLISAIGDPFQPLAAGLLLGARYAGQSVLLAGGSQMIAVLSLALGDLKPSLRASFAEGVAIATTSWLFEEGGSSSDGFCESNISRLIKLVEKHFKVKLFGFASGLRFDKTNCQPLRDYEKGYVKEGVGAGALSFLAELQGISCDDLIIECENCVSLLKNKILP